MGRNGKEVRKEEGGWGWGGAAGPIKSLLVVFRPAELPPAAAALDCFPINV